MQNKSKWQSVDKSDDPNSLDQMHYRRAKNKSSLAEKIVHQTGASNSSVKLGQKFLQEGQSINQASINKVSQDRQEYIRSVLEQRNAGSSSESYTYPSLIKKAMDGGHRQHFASQGNTVNIAPELYSPLFLTQNLQLPRDIITANAWNRAFYETNPIIRNAINLHATYPISKLSLKCDDKKVEQFFLDLAEKVDLHSVVQSVALEFWKLGESFIYSSFDESAGSWKEIYLHNPDYIAVKQAPIPGVTTISLRPDPELQKIVTSTDPAHVKIRESLDPRIVHHVLMNEYIPLDSFNISHIKNLSSPYDVRGTSIITSVWKDAMVLDKIMECFDVDTQILTRDGFKYYNDVIDTSEDNKPIPKAGVEVACYNPINDQMEFHTPSAATLRQHEGELYHFYGKKIDVKVTPNHRMYVSKKLKSSGWLPFEERLASDFSDGGMYRLKADCGWSGEEAPEFFEWKDKKFPIDTYLNFLGYLVSEGCLHRNPETYASSISVCQAVASDCYLDIKDAFTKVAEINGRKLSETISIVGAGFSAHAPIEMWRGAFSDKEFCEYLIGEIGLDGDAKSIHKRLPRWIFKLKTEKLKIILNALVKGDGCEQKRKSGHDAVHYSTISQQLADDVYELVYRCGAVPNLMKSQRKNCLEYIVTWSTTNYGNKPSIYNNEKHYGGKFKKVEYNDLVWCLTVPTDLLVVRRNGKISIQHNCKLVQADSMINPFTLVKVGSSNPDGFYPTQQELEHYRQILEDAQYSKDFKLVTHDAVSIERIGYNGGVLDVNQDIQMRIDNIFMGLMIPKAVVTQEGATYASASVALDVMRQRYNNFRTMMSNWLEQKIFAPIAEVQGFYKIENRTKRLIIPRVEWNHMTLYDLDNYLGHILGLVDKKQVSLETVYRSLGLSKENELANIRAEMIQQAILKKEEAELGKLSLAELRALDPEKPIPEKQTPALPGAPGGPGGMPGGMPDLGLAGPGSPGSSPLGGPPPDLGGLGGGGPPLDLGGGGPPGGNSPTPPGGPLGSPGPAAPPPV